MIWSMLAALAAATSAPGVPSSDVDGIRKAALDYIQGYYTGDAVRMERAIHPELAKRIFVTQKGRTRLDQMSALTLIDITRTGAGRKETNPRADVKILDHFQNVASVRIDASTWVDYLHLAKVNGDWKIINVLWELRDSGTNNPG